MTNATKTSKARTTSRRDWDRLPTVVYTDPIFFHKTQVRLGSRFRCFGRRNPNATWVAYGFWTHVKRGKAYVTAPQTLSDLVRLRCEETGETLEITFGSLSYSAIWRLES